MVRARQNQGPAKVPSFIVDRIVESLHPVEIWLFGSRARGDYRVDSDWDILAVLPDSAPDRDVDLEQTWARLRDLRVKRVDVFPVRRHDFDEAKSILGTLCQIAHDEGRRVYAS